MLSRLFTDSDVSWDVFEFSDIGKERELIASRFIPPLSKYWTLDPGKASSASLAPRRQVR